MYALISMALPLGSRIFPLLGRRAGVVGAQGSEPPNVVFVHAVHEPVDFVGSEGDTEVAHTSLLIGQHLVRPLVQGDLHPVEPNIAPAGEFASWPTPQPVDIEPSCLGPVVHRNRQLQDLIPL